MRKSMALILIMALLLGGCAGMSYTEQRVLSGGAIGAAGGAIIGGAAGAPGTGAAIGAGAGALGGYLIDRYEKSQGRP
ncbi:MAG: glycine zipper domain-containing protein [Syntrophales bacterium]|nr:glycine zipper domain-containing protein [Syntrophales bacterium]MDD5642808.1 glycine zipper domain-containing protein [Syntrophales bacterium]